MMVATIDETGITAPTYDEILGELLDKYKVLFGFDIYAEPDAQDMQMLAIFAAAVRDANDMAVAVYNSFSPSTASGVGLSSVVKINGLARHTSSYSSVGVTLTGQAGTVISNGAVSGQQGDVWLLPYTVTIPASGEVTVTATARDAGALTAAPGTIDHIITSHPGWQTVINHNSAAPGAPIETDAELRRRQAQSTAIAAFSPIQAILAGVLSVEGVTRCRIYENPTDVNDFRGVPGHSIAVVVEGGDATQIAETIAWTKSPGCGTYGTTSVIVYDPKGIPNTVNFYYLDTVAVHVRVEIQPLPGYISTIGDLIVAALARHINDKDIGETGYYNRLWAPANLSGAAATAATGLTQPELDELSEKYTVITIETSKDGINYSTDNSYVPFNVAPTCAIEDVDLIVPYTAPSAAAATTATSSGEVVRATRRRGRARR
jgi:uncharacterized phage protein gp47/JayE